VLKTSDEGHDLNPQVVHFMTNSQHAKQTYVTHDIYGHRRGLVVRVEYTPTIVRNYI